MPRLEFGEHTVDALRLIGASVDLLNALNSLVVCLEAKDVGRDVEVRLHSARAAIDKAVPQSLRRWVGKGGE